MNNPGYWSHRDEVDHDINCEEKVVAELSQRRVPSMEGADFLVWAAAGKAHAGVVYYPGLFIGP